MPAIALLLVLAAAAANDDDDGAGDRARRPFVIEVVDDQTSRGVPLIELETVHHVRLVTDSAGLAAFDEPGLMRQDVFFHIRGHGYEFPADGFGNRGKALKTEPGGAARLLIHRINIAERLYRITGAGIYRDSLLAGRSSPPRYPLLNAKVLGSDSAQVAVFRGRLHWFWGDTNRPAYPLGNFQSTGATSLLPGVGGLDPERGIDLDYFTNPDGFVRPVAPVPGDGPTWIDALVPLRDADGRERLFAAYAKVRQSMAAYARGLLEFDPETEQFRPVAAFPLDAPALPHGHPFVLDHRVWFGDPFPLVRAPANPEALKDLSRYESYTCLKPGTSPAHPEIDRDPQGRALYTWKAGVRPLDPQAQAKLVRSGTLKPEDAPLLLKDPDTGRAVVFHRGSISRNDHRQRWVAIATETGGESSFLGEVWYAEADAPTGPWAYARKVATHRKYDFYNPLQHPHFAKNGGRLIFFEGTYTTTFSGNLDPTPRYDYNQILYKLDLDDPRLVLPRPIARAAGGTILGPGVHPDATVAFYAPDRPAPGTLPIFRSPSGPPPGLTLVPPQPDASPLFHARPAGAPSPPTLPLAEALGDPNAPPCRVWRDPARTASP